MTRRMVNEVIDDEHAEVLRRIPPAERVRQLDDMFLLARAITAARIRSNRPHATEAEVEQEVSRSIADAPD